MSSTIPTTSGGTQPLDPYKAKSVDDDLPLSQKITDLSTFITEQKFGMLTTKSSDDDLLTSRCMALAGKVIILPPKSHTQIYLIILMNDNNDNRNAATRP